MVCLACLGLLAFWPVPAGGGRAGAMPDVHRAAVPLILIAICTGFDGASDRKRCTYRRTTLLTVLALAGAYVAARQAGCSGIPEGGGLRTRPVRHDRDFPLQRVISMIFKGSGGCTKVDWTFPGRSIANWSFIWFCAMALTSGAWSRQAQRAHCSTEP